MYSSILLPVDLAEPDASKRALAVAAQLARDYSATLHVVTVVPDVGMSIVGGFFPKDYERHALDEVKSRLKSFLEAEVPGGVTAKGHVAHGRIYQEILRVAKVLEADLIVMSAHRPELSDYLLGPNAARVVRHASQSVMVVRD